MKFPYFKIKEALADVRNDFNYGDGVDKVASVAKLVGKTAANVGMLSVEVGIDVVKRLPESLGKQAEHNLRNNPNLSDAQRAKLEDIVEKANSLKK
ncbi:hypothetical protein [Massilia varians]|uniref:hypothetical protein n=1 Tax=Massilia varians TaxID=457921 RepID=UPI002556F5A2|nr:hypothetical protein [Massilia varians]MDK6080492.1 hypothetical protein [Massilia varians]